MLQPVLHFWPLSQRYGPLHPEIWPKICSMQLHKRVLQKLPNQSEVENVLNLGAGAEKKQNIPTPEHVEHVSVYTKVWKVQIWYIAMVKMGWNTFVLLSSFRKY